MTCNETTDKAGRRQFLQLTLGGAAGIMAAAALPSLTPKAAAAGSTEALLLSCMDFRLMDEIERYMTGRGLRDKYDHIVLAGASLGALTDKYPAWNKTFWDHLELAVKLHHVKKLIVLDHRDCGAYKVIVGQEHTQNAAIERQTHSAQLQKFAGEVRKKYPKLEVETLLMSLDGTVEAIE